MTQTSLQRWFSAMPAPVFDPPGRGSPGAFDINRRGHDQVPDIPRVERSSTMPRTTTPSHATPVASGLDDDDDGIDLDKLVERLLAACAEHDIPISTLSLEEAAEQLLGRTAHERGDAGPPRQHLVDDEAELDDETVSRIMRHIKGRLSPSAAQ